MTLDDDVPMLLGGRWQPITRDLTFFDAPAEDCVAAWMAVRGARLEQTTGRRPVVSEVYGDIEGLLGQLPPLINNSFRRAMFVPVAGGGPYQCCMFTDASWVDYGSPRTWISQHGIGWVEVSSRAGDPRYARDPGRHDRALVVKAGAPNAATDATYRRVGLRMEDTGRRSFDDVGTPLPFEDAARYRKWRKLDRFTEKMLVEYAAALGLRPFDADFYAPDRKALVIDPTDPPYPGTRLLSMEEVRDPDFYGKPGEKGVPHPDAPPSSGDQSVSVNIDTSTGRAWVNGVLTANKDLPEHLQWLAEPRPGSGDEQV